MKKFVGFVTMILAVLFVVSASAKMDYYLCYYADVDWIFAENVGEVPYRIGFCNPSLGQHIKAKAGEYIKIAYASSSGYDVTLEVTWNGEMPQKFNTRTVFYQVPKCSSGEYELVVKADEYSQKYIVEIEEGSVQKFLGDLESEERITDTFFPMAPAYAEIDAYEGGMWGYIRFTEQDDKIKSIRYCFGHNGSWQYMDNSKFLFFNLPLDKDHVHSFKVPFPEIKGVWELKTIEVQILRHGESRWEDLGSKEFYVR